ncbi:hypothetical protein KBD71_02600 [Candidatus Woesebacteria bacterium]|nr:hypothetical protein [Candidatus Woesebacteria bacterium]
MDSFENREVLLQARKKIPFLNEIPDDIYFGLDHRELIVPEGIIASARVQLEDMLGQNVMTYNRKIFLKDVPIERHLCAHLEGAELSDEQKAVLKQYEDRYEKDGISFVVYKKPLTIIPVQNSYIYKFLTRNN